ncbi:MAG: hypothetical protein AAF517_06130 [Planctomycetota bacterium]
MKIRTLASLLYLISFPCQAHGFLLVEHDLESLILKADTIVRAERGDQIKIIAGRLLIRQEYIIKQVFQGAAVTGQAITITDNGLYDKTGKNGFLKKPLALDKEVFLFLSKPRNSRGRRDLQLIGSGLRVVSKGRVYRFLQFDNPGGYSPVPQEAYPRKIGAYSLNGTAITTKQFSADLRKAILRVKKYETFSNQDDTPQRNKKLLELLGPHRPLPKPATVWKIPYAPQYRTSEVDNKILRVLNNSTRVLDYFDAFTRVEPGTWKRFDTKPHSLSLSVAGKESQSLATRIVALWFLERNTSRELPNGAETIVKTLANHSNERIQLAAISLLEAHLKSSTTLSDEFTLGVLKDAWRRTDSPRTRMHLARAFGIKGAAAATDLPLPEAFLLADFEPFLEGRLYRTDIHAGVILKDSTAAAWKRELIVRDARGQEVRRMEIPELQAKASVPENEPDRDDLIDTLERYPGIANETWNHRLVLLSPALKSGSYTLSVTISGKGRDGKPASVESPPQKITVAR